MWKCKWRNLVAMINYNYDGDFGNVYDNDDKNGFWKCPKVNDLFLRMAFLRINTLSPLCCGNVFFWCNCRGIRGWMNSLWHNRRSTKKSRSSDKSLRDKVVCNWGLAMFATSYYWHQGFLCAPNKARCANQVTWSPFLKHYTDVKSLMFFWSFDLVVLKVPTGRQF